FRSDPDRVRRLISDHAEVEAEYWERTGFFPIMHTVVLRRDVYEAHPWIAVAYMDAFEESRRRGQERLRKATSPALALPWLDGAVDELDEVFDGEALPIGFERNRPILEAMVGYSHEQGLAESAIRPEDVFARETLSYEP